MKKIFLKILALIGFVTTSLWPCGAQEETAEPVELTRLREQFQARVEQELVPWNDKYKKELQKLEDRLIQERKLTEALAVRNERESKDPKLTEAAKPVNKEPKTIAEAKEMVTGSVWLVYAAEDKKCETLLDVYHFYDENRVFLFSTKRTCEWSAKSANDVAIPFIAGDINVNLKFTKTAGKAIYLGKEYQIYFSGKPKLKED